MHGARVNTLEVAGAGNDRILASFPLATTVTVMVVMMFIVTHNSRTSSRLKASD
jgi:hypothetical protein